jgi:hypothetical protein
MIIIFWLFLFILAANLPWLIKQCPFGHICRWQSLTKKPFLLQFIAWLLLYVLIMSLGFAFEYKAVGSIKAQGWEFYVITVSLFAVSALPGLVYRYQVQHLLTRL